MRAWRDGAAVAVLAVLVGGLVGCGSQAPVPDVVGVALDDAHNKLKEAGFEELDDKDLFEDRSILVDSNWVVLEQAPAAGQAADQDSAVTLRVGKIGEERTIERLPEGSPVLAAAMETEAARTAQTEAARTAQTARDQADQAAATAEQRRLLSGYVNDLDPLVRLGNRLFGEFDRTAQGIREDEYGFTQSDVVRAGLGALDALTNQLEGREPPNGSKRVGSHQAMLTAAARLREGAATLLSAVDDQRASSLARWDDVRRDARAQWNSAIIAVYMDSGVAPPLLP